MAKPEQNLQISICEYLKLQYPHVIFFSEPSGLRVSMGQAKILKRMRSYGKLPDLFIAFPNGKYHGMFVELKTEESNPFLKSGGLSKTEHIQGQLETLKKLHDLGYAAVFGVGFDDTKNKIDRYFALEKINPEQNSNT
jgi:hypothetical protein